MTDDLQELYPIYTSTKLYNTQPKNPNVEDSKKHSPEMVGSWFFFFFFFYYYFKFQYWKRLSKSVCYKKKGNGHHLQNITYIFSFFLSFFNLLVSDTLFNILQFKYIGNILTILQFIGVTVCKLNLFLLNRYEREVFLFRWRW